MRRGKLCIVIRPDGLCIVPTRQLVRCQCERADCVRRRELWAGRRCDKAERLPTMPCGFCVRHWRECTRHLLGGFVQYQRCGNARGVRRGRIKSLMDRRAVIYAHLVDGVPKARRRLLSARVARIPV